MKKKSKVSIILTVAMLPLTASYALVWNDCEYNCGRGCSTILRDGQIWATYYLRKAQHNCEVNYEPDSEEYENCMSYAWDDYDYYMDDVDDQYSDCLYDCELQCNDDW